MNGADINPWLSLPNEAPFVLESDRYIIDASNRLHGNHIELCVRPDPFVGNPEAKVLLVLLNPGFDAAERGDKWWHAHSRVLAQHYARNYRHDSDFFWLHDDLRESPGGAWYRKKLKALLTDVGIEAVRRGLFLVEYFPYHSKDGSNLPIVPSQEYAHRLVRKAVKRGALIILMRAARALKALIPELSSYKNLALARSRNASISERNVTRYSDIVQALARNRRV